MPDPSPDIERLEALTDALVDERITPAEFDELEAYIKTEAARRFVVKRLQLSASLCIYSSELDGAAAPETTTARSGKKNQRLILAMAFAGLVIALLILLSVLNSSPEPSPIATEWRDGTPVEHFTGTYKTQENFAQLELSSGARLALDPRTEIDLLAANRVKLIRGALGAEVPPQATGFTVLSEHGRVVDQGTRFGVRLETGGLRTELFEGELEIHSQNEVLALTNQQAAHVRQTSGIKILGTNVDPLRFPMPTSRRVVAVTKGHFEPGDRFEIGEDIRAEAGRWGGNVSKIVPRFGEVVPYSGKGMLQFISSADRGGAGLGKFCDVWQWIDLRQQPLEPNAEIEVEMMVNRLAGLPGLAGDRKMDTRFAMILHAHTKLVPFYPADGLDATATWTADVESDNDPATWEPLTLKKQIPAGTKFLLLHVRAEENHFNNEDPQDVEFEGHFIDHINMWLCLPGRASQETIL